MFPAPVAGLELAWELALGERLPPTAVGEFVEVANEDGVQLAVAKVWLDPLGPVAFEVIVSHGKTLTRFGGTFNNCLEAFRIVNQVDLRTIHALVSRFIHRIG
jgi:hypothetical protein